ncbi:MAG: manganese efflux pump [bacterium]|nr:MAG: manganese efflux pump [bacterium]
MNTFNVILIALALAMDAFAVSIATGVSLRKVSIRQRFRLSWHFGLFQALMPVIGWYAGSSVHEMIQKYDHWVAAGLLSLVGVNMIWNYLVNKENEKPDRDPTKGFTLFILSLSTSIDALAVGFSMSMLKISIVIPAAIIGLVALLATLIGLELGSKFGLNSRISPLAKIIGGLILIVIGIKILYDHGILSIL